MANWGDEGVEEIMDLWTGMMGTTQMTETELPNLEAVDESSVDFLSSLRRSGGQEFHHYRVNGGGTHWFGVWGNQDIQSTDLLWDFFASHCSGELTSMEETMAAETGLAYWNGDHIGLLADCSIAAWDAQGRLVWRQSDLIKGTVIDSDQLKEAMVVQVMNAQGQRLVLRVR